MKKCPNGTVIDKYCFPLWSQTRLPHTWCVGKKSETDELKNIRETKIGRLTNNQAVISEWKTVGAMELFVATRSRTDSGKAKVDKFIFGCQKPGK